METLIYKVDINNPEQKNIEKAADLLKDGQVVAFPTETVYGLGAVATNTQAVSKIFQAKGRPGDNPLIVHIENISEIENIAYFDDRVPALAEAFWPGPLTIVLPKKDSIPPSVTANLDTVAIRMPANAIALSLIKAVGAPIAAPSANTSSKPSPTKAKHVFDDLNEKIPLILDGGSVDIGLESTVLDLTKDTPRILRPGKITAEDLRPILGEVLFAHMEEPEKPASPGMKYAHYAPEGQVILCSSKDIVKLWHENMHYAPFVICWEESAADLPAEANAIILGKAGDLESYAKNIFMALRLCDTYNAVCILIEEVPEVGLGLAIMNRLKKAAANS